MTDPQGREPAALDLDAIEVKWLNMCGPCDAGLGMKCSHPDEDYRPVIADLVAEVRRLRHEGAEERTEWALRLHGTNVVTRITPDDSVAMPRGVVVQRTVVVGPWTVSEGKP